MGIEYQVLPDSAENARSVIFELIEKTNRIKQPVALIVKKNTFSPYTLRSAEENGYTLCREDAIKMIVDTLDDDTVVVSTTGKPSRELFELRATRSEGHKKDFLTVGGMGHASQIALGIALAQPDRQVCCLDGDGAALMHAGGLGIIGQYNPDYKHVILNNGAHESVGGQPTIGLAIDLCGLAESMGYGKTFCATTEQELQDMLPVFLKERGAVFLEVRISIGSRSTLGRPTTTPLENKTEIMKFLND
jgi:phosphonopyruvate decarboxylase